MLIKADSSLRAYYNEIDPFAAEWLRSLMSEGLITKGDVDERSIEDVKPNDILGYDRVHMFAGIGVWDFALNQAGWGRSEAWTGSCPCQPFSAAGKGNGFDDERHLWPAFHWLIQQCQPSVVFGEQVSSSEVFGSQQEVDFAVAVRQGNVIKANKLAKKLSKSKGFSFHQRWIDLVQADLEGLGYAFGVRAFPSSCVGAPHIRDRAYWVGHAERSRLEGFAGHGNNGNQSRRLETQPVGPVAETGSNGGMADASGERREWGQRAAQGGQHDWPDAGRQQGNDGHICIGETGDGSRPTGPTNGFWGAADWLYCRDGKWRPVEPGTCPLASGITNRVGKLRGYGNAINAQAAKVFIESVMESSNV